MCGHIMKRVDGKLNMPRPLKRGSTIHLRIPTDLKKRCQMRAKEDKKSLTEWIEEAMQVALRSANRTTGAAGSDRGA